MGAPQEEWATVREARAVRSVLGTLAESLGEPDRVCAGLVTVREQVRARVRRRRAAKALATGATACLVAGALVAGVAHASPWRAAHPVPAGTDHPSPTSSEHLPTPDATAATSHAWDTVTATYDDGYSPEGYDFLPADERAKLTCGAPESGLVSTAGTAGFSVEASGGLRTVPDPWLEDSDRRYRALTVRVTVPHSAGAFSGIDPQVVLVQGGRVVDLLDDGSIEPAYTATDAGHPEYRTAPSFERTWYQPTGAQASRCLREGLVGHGPIVLPSDATPRHAPGTYRAYLAVSFGCADLDDCAAFLKDQPVVFSEPFTVTVAADGTLGMAFDG